MATKERDTTDDIQRSIGESIDDRNVDLGHEFFTEYHTGHHPASPESVSESGPEFCGTSMQYSDRAFPGGEGHIGDPVAEGALVSFDGTVTGPHKGEFREFEPTNPSIGIRGPGTHRVRDNQIADSWATWEYHGRQTRPGVGIPPER